MKENHTLLSFPCDFLIKIVGDYTEDFIESISAIVRKHFSEIKDNYHHVSRQSKYVAISVNVHARYQEELDALYQEVRAYPGVKMVL